MVGDHVRAGIDRIDIADVIAIIAVRRVVIDVLIPVGHIVAAAPGQRPGGRSRPSDRIEVAGRIEIGRLDVPVEIAIVVIVPVVAGTAIAARLPGIITLPVEPAFAGGKTPLESATLLPPVARQPALPLTRSEEHTSELQSLMRISYAVLCLKKKKR